MRAVIDLERDKETLTNKKWKKNHGTEYNTYTRLPFLALFAGASTTSGAFCG
jgi:hypothetical protein